jgi:hypothetical protein
MPTNLSTTTYSLIFSLLFLLTPLTRLVLLGTIEIKKQVLVEGSGNHDWRHFPSRGQVVTVHGTSHARLRTHNHNHKPKGVI